MRHPNETRFGDFFVHDTYVALKNHLYNYRLRRAAIGRALAGQTLDRVLEVGSGLSPIVTDRDRIVYSDLSLAGVAQLRRLQRRGLYVVADCTRLPFRPGTFSHAVCSEVLEHVEDDGAALGELARVLAPGGQVCLTVPHRRFYFGNDDRFAGHFRRYELPDLLAALAARGLRPVEVRTVLGPLEKLTMSACVLALETLRLFRPAGAPGPQRRRRPPPAPLVTAFRWANTAYAALCALEARIVPRALAAVVLIRATR